MSIENRSTEEALEQVTRALLNSRNAAGHWEGELSSSALSTATAIFAMGLYQKFSKATQARLSGLIDNGVSWLIQTQNPDGGWGDTILSISNISTTVLCWAALAEHSDRATAPLQKAELWLINAAGSLRAIDLAHAIKARYGKDQTFSVPILTMCALAGRFGEGPSAWKTVPQLPFELAACPYQWFQWLRLPVVSYALPALIAIGLVRYARRRSWNLPANILRWMTRRRTLRLLQQIQPTGGGFLEATPLTSFVVMSLIGAGQHDQSVVMNGIDFLARSARANGSWPIDTNLATWLTTLSVNALAEHRDFDTILPEPDRRRIHQWLIGQQYREEHPYTHAPPGAWAWTDLPGGVPDADDTAGALLALWNLGDRQPQTLDSVQAGIVWLLNIQNRDGGIPTFCRGWGNLPFDRSGCDLTAHALQAWAVWRNHLDRPIVERIDHAIERGFQFLKKHQSPDGSWVPLWFGNQFCPNDENKTYGTAKVLTALCAVGSEMTDECADLCNRAARWLVKSQQPKGGWGGQATAEDSIEETSLAVHALAMFSLSRTSRSDEDIPPAMVKGRARLLELTAHDPTHPPAPIGFYFARLWYFERQYPLIYACAALVAVGEQSRFFVSVM